MCFLLAHKFIHVPTLFIILLSYNVNAAKLDYAFGHHNIIAQMLLLNKQKNLKMNLICKSLKHVLILKD